MINYFISMENDKKHLMSKKSSTHKKLILMVGGTALDFVKCDVCGKYDERIDHNLQMTGVNGVPNLCGECIEESERKNLAYDAYECGFDSVEDYLAAKKQWEAEQQNEKW